MDSKEALKIEKQKRKAVAKRRICWLLGILDIALVIYIAVQIIILVQ
ncbi:MAG: hypothetical protein J6M95_02535 [Bacilli bacterium]|nr:hypothetical protein [Bacilli bacterium]